MKKTMMAILLSIAATGCGDDKKAITPQSQMQPPGAGAEQEGGKGKSKKDHAVNEG